MVWCNHCGKNVPGVRPYDGALACNLCGRILENFNFSTEVTFVKNAAGQSQASGNIVRSVESGISSSRERRLRIARDELMNLKDALGIGDETDAVVNMAARFFRTAVDHNFTKGRRSDLVLSSCLYLSCRVSRPKKIPVLLIEFSSYLRVSVYELGSVYLQFCEMLYLLNNQNYEEFVDPSIFIPRFTNMLLKGAHTEKEKQEVVKTATYIIASMKRDWMQFMNVSGGLEGGFDPPAFQRAEKQRMKEKASREENDEQLNSERDPYYSSVSSKRENDEAWDESSTLSDVDDREVDCYILSPKEAHEFGICWNLLNAEYNEKEEAAKKAAALNASNNCPENARNLAEATKAAVAKSRKEKRQKRAEEEKNAPPPATAMEAVGRMVEKKKFSGLNYDALEELFDTYPTDKKPRTETETVTEKKKEGHEIVENEQDEGDEEEEEGYAAPYEMNTDEKDAPIVQTQYFVPFLENLACDSQRRSSASSRLFQILTPISFPAAPP